MVDHESCVELVDAHSEGYCCNHYLHKDTRTMSREQESVGEEVGGNGGEG